MTAEFAVTDYKNNEEARNDRVNTISWGRGASKTHVGEIGKRKKRVKKGGNPDLEGFVRAEGRTG